MAQGGQVGYFFIGIDEKDGYLFILGFNGVVQRLLLHAVTFAAQAFNAVTVYRMGKIAAGHGKACLYGVLVYRQLRGHINHAVWKNRKRFSVSKKRFNQFPAL